MFPLWRTAWLVFFFKRREKNSFHSLPAISMEIKFPAKTQCPNTNILSRKWKIFFEQLQDVIQNSERLHPKYFARWLQTKHCRAREDGEPNPVQMPPVSGQASRSGVRPAGMFRARPRTGRGGRRAPAGTHRPVPPCGFVGVPGAASAAALRRGREQSPRCPAAVAGLAAPAPRSPCPAGRALAGPPGSAAAAQSGPSGGGGGGGGAAARR